MVFKAKKALRRMKGKKALVKRTQKRADNLVERGKGGGGAHSFARELRDMHCAFDWENTNFTDTVL